MSEYEEDILETSWNDWNEYEDEDFSDDAEEL